MSKRQSPLQRGHLAILSHGEPAISIEVECRYPDLLLAAIQSFMRPGARAEWRVHPPRAKAWLTLDPEAKAAAITRHVAGGPEPDEVTCRHKWTSQGNCIKCGARYHGPTPFKAEPEPKSSPVDQDQAEEASHLMHAALHKANPADYEPSCSHGIPLDEDCDRCAVVNSIT